MVKKLNIEYMFLFTTDIFFYNTGRIKMSNKIPEKMGET